MRSDRARLAAFSASISRNTADPVLLREITLRGAQLLVMGAFGHSRVREYLFGGVTRSMLEMRHGPALLLAH